VGPDAPLPPPPARPPVRSPARAPFPEPPSRDGARAKALREYRAQHLAVQRLTETRIGTAWSYGYRRVWGPYGPGWGWAAFPHPFVVRTDAIGVFRGPERIDVPTTLDALGELDRQRDLEQRIATNRTLATTAYGIGVAGVAASIVGLIGLDNASTFDEAAQWSTVSTTGLGLIVGGFVGGSIPSARAQRLQYDHTATEDIDDLGRRIAAHNAVLAEELGLSPDEAERIDTAPLVRR
jgi:hypothetical protein